MGGQWKGRPGGRLCCLGAFESVQWQGPLRPVQPGDVDVCCITDLIFLLSLYRLGLQGPSADTGGLLAFQVYAVRQGEECKDSYPQVFC